MQSLTNYASKTGIPEAELTGRCRQQHIALARQVFWYYLWQRGHKVTSIAKMFNRSAHSTIISGINTVRNLENNHELVRMYINQLDSG